MDINFYDLPAVIYQCFIPHNFSEMRNDMETNTETGCQINDNEAGSKMVRGVYVKYFE